MQKLISDIIEGYETGRISRREFISGLALLAGSRTQAAGAGSPFKGIGLNHVALNVTDLARSRDFYQKLLGLPVLQQSAGSCFLGLGSDFLTLFRKDKAAMDHFCLAIENYDVRTVTEELRRQGLNPDQPPGTERVYFRDPDGLVVQLSSSDHKP